MASASASSSDPTFLAGGGEMGALMRAHDWSTSPVGNPETWPQSLRSVVQLMLSNRQLMFVAWGPELVFLYNDGYAPTFGKKHPGALGRPFREVWSEIWDDIEPLVTAALGGETTYSENLHLVMERNGYPEDAWFTFSYSSLRDESGAVAGMFCAGIETTGQVLAEQRLAAERDRQRRLFQQAPGFITILSGPELRFEFVNESYDGLFGHRGFVGKTVREVFPDLEGQPFFDLLNQAYATGERFIARSLPIRLQATPEAEPADHFLDFIYEPVRDEDDVVTGIFIEGHDVTERVQAERRREALVEFSDRIREVGDPDDLTYAAAEILGRTLGVTRAGYGAIDARAETVMMVRDWNAPGNVSVAGVLSFRDFGSYVDALKRGETTVVTDVRSDPRTAANAASFAAAGACSFINVPVTQQGDLVALIFVDHAEPRVWTDAEVALVREVGERTRTAVERLRAEQEVRDSEGRYRTLFEAIDAGFCIFDMIFDKDGRASDFRFVEVNPAFERQTGVVGVVGRRMREVAPDLEEVWFERYGRVALTGEPLRVEDEAAALGRWYDINAFRVGAPEQRRVAALFNDMTARRKTEAELRESEARQRFRVELGDALRGLTAPSEIMAAVGERLGPYLGVDQANYYLVDGDRFVVSEEWRSDRSAGLIGSHRIADFGPEARRLMDRKEMLRLGDTRGADGAEGYAAAGMVAVLSAPLHSGGRWTGGFHVHTAVPRAWTDKEASLVRETAERAWAEMERARAEASLRDSEARQAFLLSLSDALRLLGTPAEIASAAAERLGERFGLSRVFYAEYFGSVMRVERDFTRGVDSIVGEHDLAAFGPELLRAYHECPVVKVDDVATDARFGQDARAGLQARQVGAYLDVVLFEDEQWVSLLAFQSAEPRKWTAAEEGLFREVGERVKSAIERARAEKQLRDLNADLERQVVERTHELGRSWAITPDMLSVIDMATGAFDRVNPAWTATFGWSADELEGSVFADFLHPDDLPASYDALEVVRRGDPLLYFENRYRTKAGDYRWVRWVVVPEAGKLYSTARDVTEEKRQAAELAARTAERDRLWQNSQDVLVVIDTQGAFRTVNPSFTRILGWTEAEAVGRTVFDFIHPDDKAPTLGALEHAAGRELPTFENRYRHKDGGWRWLAWVAAPEGDLIFATARHVTAEKEAAAELAQAQEALRQSQKMEAMGSLTGGVAHDFNNLLTPIIGSLDMLVRKGVGSERERRLIDGALQSAERAKTLVQRLLAFARRQPLQPVAVDIGRLVDGMAGLIGSTLGPTIDIRVDLAPDLPAAKADPNQLEMALLNLAVNARDAMPDGGELTIAARRESVRGVHVSGLKPGHYVRLCVTDSGVGMDQATLARAIEPFFSTKGIGKGTGLGLSMVHGLAAQLGGGLSIDSVAGRGTSIDLWLPISSVVVGDDEEAAPVPPTRVGRGTALLVDDEELVRMSTADMLIDLGFEVVEAGSAEEALQLIKGGITPDLLVTDHLMPGMTGADLAREARALKPSLPVLLVSGYADVEGIGPEWPRLTKPFRNAELANSVSALVPAEG